MILILRSNNYYLVLIYVRMSIYNIHSVIVHIPMYCHECNSLRKRVPKILRQLNVIYTITFKLSTTVIHTIVGMASIKAITKCISHFCNMLLSLAGASLLGRHYMLILLLHLHSIFIVIIKHKVISHL